jgi:hypothetical protein
MPSLYSYSIHLYSFAIEFLDSTTTLTDITNQYYSSKDRTYAEPIQFLQYQNPVLHHAPLIPAGMEAFHWNPQEWTGIRRNGTGIHRNGQESTGMD